MECSHEWSAWTPDGEQEDAESTEAPDFSVRDAYGNELKTGDSISVIKDLKVGGTSLVVKVGTKVKNIQIVDSTNGHNIACRIDGIGAMNLKSEFVKKV